VLKWFQTKVGEIYIGYKKLFTVRVVRHGHRLPRDEVDAPSLQTAKVRLDGAVSTDGALGVPAQCREGGRRPLGVPSNSNHSMTSALLVRHKEKPHWCAEVTGLVED